ncbi:hypothetical protein GCM10010468_49360 [Actinocorallia longicatena]|uniref:Uncharacterized protein n=1 Tax=Actinocorallia longicatena TaxID=111803 RepID=A0ABP6QDY3_9ACTN
MSRRSQVGSRPSRPTAAPNGGRGKELPRDEAGFPMPEVPRNRRERRALAAWRRKNGGAR